MNNNILSFKENISNMKDTKIFYIEKLSLKNFRNHKYLNHSSFTKFMTIPNFLFL